MTTRRSEDQFRSCERCAYRQNVGGKSPDRLSRRHSTLGAVVRTSVVGRTGAAKRSASPVVNTEGSGSSWPYFFMESQQRLSRNSKSARSSNTTREARPTLGPPVIMRSCACCHRKKSVREHTVSRATPSLSSGAPRNTKSSQSTSQPLSGPQQRSCHDRGHEHLPFQWHIAIVQYRRGTYKRLRRRYVTSIVRV